VVYLAEVNNKLSHTLVQGWPNLLYACAA